MGWKGDPHLNPLHLFSDVLIIAGFILLAASLEKLYKAQRTHVGGLVLLAGAWRWQRRTSATPAQHEDGAAAMKAKTISPGVSSTTCWGTPLPW